ncbi:MAG: O-antigen ligase family protein [Patescibacteria group bacterium]
MKISILRYSIISALAITLATPLIVALQMYFPYITGKALFMRTFILIAAVLYVMLVSIDKTYKPRKSILMYGVLGFMLILIASWLNSVNPTRSFWSNFERMEGLVTLLYMGVLFVIAGAVVKKREWTWLMNSSLVISMVVGFLSLGDFSKTAPGGLVRLSGTLGNSSYLGIYSLIHIFLAFLAILMIYRGRREEQLLSSGTHDAAKKLSQSAYVYMGIYALVGLFNAYILFYTGTRGSFIGLLGGLLLTSGYLAWKEKEKVLRFGAMGFLTAVFVSIILLGALKNSPVVTDSPSLARFASLITTDVKGVLESQGAARTTLWNMAYQGVEERPLLGWGQDTFGYVFAKYYDPAMHAQEQWFDRSHNVFLDWLISAGVFGLLGYLFLFAAALVCIFSSRARLTIVEKSILIGLLAAYFIHNLFVFDNLSSYVLFFLLLAYMHDRFTHDRAQSPVVVKKGEVDLGTIMIAAGFFSILIGSYVGYKTIYQPYAQNRTLISAMQYAQEQERVTDEMLSKMKKVPMDVSYDEFKKVFTLGHTGEAEGYEQLMNMALQAIASPTVGEKTKLNFIELYKERIEYHEAHSAGDPRFAYFASNYYSKLGVLDNAYKYAKQAYDLSPSKQSFAYALAVLEFEKKNLPEALRIVKQAYESAPESENSFAYYVSTLLEDAKLANGTGYSLVKLGGIAPILAEGYTKYKHDLVLETRFWDVIKSVGKNGEAKVLSARLIELIPEKKAELQAFVK